MTLAGSELWHFQILENLGAGKPDEPLHAALSSGENKTAACRCGDSS